MSPEELQHLKDRERRVYKEDRKGGWRGRRRTQECSPGFKRLSKPRTGGACRVIRVEVIVEPLPRTFLVVVG